MNIKEMIYGGDKSTQGILAEGWWGSYQWKVCSMGSHPCGYVSIPDHHPLRGKLDLLEQYISCHGGITFYNERIDSGWGTEFYIGWDYAHAGDFKAGYDQDGDKYTTEYVMNECYYVIGQLEMYERVHALFEMDTFISKDMLRELLGD